MRSMIVTDTNKRKEKNLVFSERLWNSDKGNFIEVMKSAVQIRVQKFLIFRLPE